MICGTVPVARLNVPFQPMLDVLAVAYKPRKSRAQHYYSRYNK
jgi:hypothetical protein